MQDLLPALDAERIRSTIAELSAMQNRYYQSDSGAAASLWLRDRWQSFTSRPDVTIELFDHGYPQKSVILAIPGTTRASEVVVIGGHLDSIALGDRASTAPGADDDASGIATLTEVARVLLERDIAHPHAPADRLRRRGGGPARLTLDRARVPARGVDVVGALQLDMTNYQGSDRDIWLIQDFTSAAQNEFLARLIDSYVGASLWLRRVRLRLLDHASWHRAGIPASMPFESRSRDRNKLIHTAKDTLETSGNNAAHALKFARLAARLRHRRLGQAAAHRPPAGSHSTASDAAILLLYSRSAPRGLGHRLVRPRHLATPPAAASARSSLPSASPSRWRSTSRPAAACSRRVASRPRRGLGHRDRRVWLARRELLDAPLDRRTHRRRYADLDRRERPVRERRQLSLEPDRSSAPRPYADRRSGAQSADSSRRPRLARTCSSWPQLCAWQARSAGLARPASASRNSSSSGECPAAASRRGA